MIYLYLIKSVYYNFNYIKFTNVNKSNIGGVIQTIRTDAPTVYIYATSMFGGVEIR